MDSAGAETLDELLDDLDERGVRLVLARVRTSLRTTLRRLGFDERLGPERFHLRIRDAVADFVRRNPAGGGSDSAAAEQPPPAAPPAGAGYPTDGHEERTTPSG